MNLDGSSGTAMIIMVFFFEGPLFPLIFGQALRGMGRHTKTASVFITAAVSGGSAFSPASNHIISVDGRAKYALVVGVAVFAFGTVFPIWLNASPLARRQCDPIKDVTRSLSARPESSSGRTSKALDLLRLRKKRRKESGSVEWKEERTANDGS